MPQFDILKTVPIEKTARAMQISGIFDVPPTACSVSKWSVNLPIEEQSWQIGLILGASGSGKSTLAKEAFKNAKYVISNEGFEWSKTKTIVDGFPDNLSIKEICNYLSSVGFSSPPSWMRPFDALSTGEQFRTTLARALADNSDVIILDEFTSVIDRNVAKIGSYAVSKAVKRSTKKVVCVTCHEDVAEWLCPDWIMEMPSGNFTRRLLQRPPIVMEVKRVHRSAWELFKKYHYLSSEHHSAAYCFVGFVWGIPAAYCSVLHFPTSKGLMWKEHRTVVQPDFQGVGLGNKLSDYVGSLFQSTNKPYRDNTAHPAHIHYRKKSPNWQVIRDMGLIKPSNSQLHHMNKTVSSKRLTMTFKYIGPSNPVDAKGFGVIK